MNRNPKKQLVEGLWVEIEKAVFSSPDVRDSLNKLTTLDPKADVSEYNLHLDIEKLCRLIREERERSEGPPKETESPLAGSTPKDPEQLSLFQSEFSLMETRVREIFSPLRWDYLTR